jgi:hypothetical protein
MLFTEKMSHMETNLDTMPVVHNKFAADNNIHSLWRDTLVSGTVWKPNLQYVTSERKHAYLKLTSQ